MKISEFLSHFRLTFEINPKIWGFGIISTSHQPDPSGHISIHFMPFIITLHVCGDKK